MSQTMTPGAMFELEPADLERCAELHLLNGAVHACTVVRGHTRSRTQRSPRRRSQLSDDRVHLTAASQPCAKPDPVSASR